MQDSSYSKLIVLMLSCILLSNCKQSPQRPAVSTELVTKTATPKVQSSLKYEVRLPTISSNNPPVLFLLHGYGSNEKDLFSFAPAIPGEFLVICPQAPIQLADNRYSWYPFNRNQPGTKQKADKVVETSELLLSFIHEIKSKYSVDDEGIFIGGFSQGAITTLSTTLMHPDEIDGLVCLSGELYPEIKSQLKKSSNLPHIFISHGTNDKVLGIDNMDAAQEFLITEGYDVTFKKYDAAHTITRQNLTDMVNWLTLQLQ